MANINAPFGAEPIQNHDGSAPLVMREYYCDASANIFIGDVVKLGTDSDAAGTSHEVVALAAGGGDPVGIVVGIRRNKPNATNIPDGQNYKKTADVVYLQVADDPNLLFRMQCSNGTLTAANIGLNVDIAATAGSTVTGRSKFSVDVATVATTATLPIRIRGVDPKVGNAIGAEAVVLCSWNVHAYRTDRVAV